MLAGCESLRSGCASTLIADNNVDAVIVCAENARHAELTSDALQAGKDVAVEFPLALSARSCRQLHELATAHRRILHVEVIGLLTAGYAQWRDWAGGAGSRGLRVESRFRGGAYRWVADEIEAGRVGQLAVGRLHLLQDSFGPLRLVSVKGTASAQGYRLDAFLRGLADERIVVTEERRPEYVRGYELLARSGDRQFSMPRARRDEGLFGRDLAIFLDRVGTRRDGERRGQAARHVDREDVVAVAQLAEAISEGWLASVGRGGTEPG